MTTEREHVEAVKAGLASAKGTLKAISGELTGIMDKNEDAGKRNAAFLARARIRRVLADLEIAHGEMTEDLLKHWPEYEGIVAFGPGGGR